MSGVRSVRVPGADLAVEVEGPADGIPLLLVHGFPLTRAMWRPQVAAFGEMCRLIAPDLRGLGESRHDGFPITIETYVDDLLAVLDALERRPVVACGLSMGGYVVLRAVARAPERFHALVLADTRSAPDDDPGRLARAGAVERLRRGEVGPYGEEMLGALLAASTVQGRPDVVDRIRTIVRSNGASGMALALLAMAARTDTTPSLADIRQATLVVVGADDRITPPAVSEAMAAAIPRSRLEVIPEAGHLPNLENPGAFNRALTSFLGSLRH